MRLIKNDTIWNDPFSEMDHFLNRSFGSPLSQWIGNLQEKANRSFRLDFLQDDDNFYVVAEIPGHNKKEVSIELENAVLTISADPKTKNSDNTESRKSARSITVGDEISEDNVSAKLENGLLIVTLPKAEHRKPRSIEIA